MKLNKVLAIAAIFGALAFTGCKNDDPNDNSFDNKLYLDSEAKTTEMLIKGSVAGYSQTISAAVAKPAEADIKITYKADPSLVKTYNTVYYAEAVALPAENYVFENTVAEIKAGSVKSTTVDIDFVNINTLDRETLYVLPVTIAQVSGIDVLQSARTMYYIFKGAALINVVADLTENRAWPEFNNDARLNNMSELTLEALVYPYQFGKLISTVMGIEGNFLIRCGDAGIADSQVQVASSNNVSNSDCQLETGKWSHIAVTFNGGNVEIYINGVLKCTGYCGRSTVSLGAKHHNEEDGSRVFWVGYSYSSDRYFGGLMSECRIWNRALTSDEINAPDHFYQVAPDSEGLLAYWKFDDGAGSTVKDHTGNGFDLTVGKVPAWVNVSLPESTK